MRRSHETPLQEKASVFKRGKYPLAKLVKYPTMPFGGQDTNCCMRTNSEIRKAALVGDYLPRKCGIATFTTNLCESLKRQYRDTTFFAVPVNDMEGGYEYPKEVRFEIEEQDLSAYQRAADFLNISNVDLVSLQHEFGIYGGTAGGHILAMVRELKMPLVTTFHTILRQPNPDERRVMQELVSRSTRLVVMAQRGAELLQEIFQAPREKIDVIPHGIPDMQFVDPSFYKDKFGVEGKVVFSRLACYRRTKESNRF